MLHINDSIVQNMFPEFTHIVNRICTPSWEITKSIYEKHNIILIYDGSAEFECNGRRYTGTKGCMIYFKPGDIRWGKTSQENPMKCFAVDFVYTYPTFSNNKWETYDMELPFNTMEKINDSYLFSRILNFFNECTKFWLSDGYNNIIRCRGCFMEIMSLLLIWKSGQGIQYDKIRKVDKVIRYIVENYDQQLRLEDLSNLVKISPSYLGSIFKEVTGNSPIEYLINIRITQSKQFINDGYSISETAEKVGFNDVFYFSKCFKNKEGMSPTKYKNR